MLFWKIGVENLFEIQRGKKQALVGQDRGRNKTFSNKTSSIFNNSLHCLDNDRLFEHFFCRDCCVFNIFFSLIIFQSLN